MPPITASGFKDESRITVPAPQDRLVAGSELRRRRLLLVIRISDPNGRWIDEFEHANGKFAKSRSQRVRKTRFTWTDGEPYSVRDLLLAKSKCLIAVPGASRYYG